MSWSCPRHVEQSFRIRMICWVSSCLFTQTRGSTETDNSHSVLRSGQPTLMNLPRFGLSENISKIHILLQVKCETKIYHPNIDLEGNVCLNILREDWKPVLTINSIVYGLQYLFLVSSICTFTALEQWIKFACLNIQGGHWKIPFSNTEVLGLWYWFL